MIDSLRDQLLKLGFPEPAKEPPKPPLHASRPHGQQENSSPRNRPQQDRPQRNRAAGDRPPSATQERDRQRQGQLRPAAGAPQNRPAHPHPRPPSSGAWRPQGNRTQAEIDLGKAYALRAQTEKDERIEAERQKQEAARLKREAKTKVAELLKDNTLNDAAAELVRHFDYSGKIKRVHVNAEQLKALNAGELGVVQLDGRYLLVTADHARQTQALLPSLLALLVDPDAPVADDPYADPAYRVPDDLVW